MLLPCLLLLLLLLLWLLLLQRGNKPCPLPGMWPPLSEPLRHFTLLLLALLLLLLRWLPLSQPAAFNQLQPLQCHTLVTLVGLPPCLRLLR